MAAAIFQERGVQYGPIDEMFDRASKLASVILQKDLTPYDISIIMHCIKLSRLSEDKTHLDSYVDGINYLAFGAYFGVPAPQGPVVTQQDPVVIEDEIAAVTQQFAEMASTQEETNVEKEEASS